MFQSLHIISSATLASFVPSGEIASWRICLRVGILDGADGAIVLQVPPDQAIVVAAADDGVAREPTAVAYRP